MSVVRLQDLLHEKLFLKQVNFFFVFSIYLTEMDRSESEKLDSTINYQYHQKIRNSYV